MIDLACYFMFYYVMLYSGIKVELWVQTVDLTQKGKNSWRAFYINIYHDFSKPLFLHQSFPFQSTDRYHLAKEKVNLKSNPNSYPSLPSVANNPWSHVFFLSLFSNLTSLPTPLAPPQILGILPTFGFIKTIMMGAPFFLTVIQVLMIFFLSAGNVQAAR